MSENSGQFLNNQRRNVALRKNIEGGGIRLLDSCRRWNKIHFKGSRIYSLLCIGAIHLEEGWMNMGIGVGLFDEFNFGFAKATKRDFLWDISYYLYKPKYNLRQLTTTIKMDRESSATHDGERAG